jgi:hypothetical protein
MNMRAWDAPPEYLDELLPEAFDEYDDKHMVSVAPHGLASEIQGFLLLRREWETLNLHQRSEQCESLMNSLYKACLEKYRDL